MKRFLTILILVIVISPVYAMPPYGGGGGPFIKYNFHNIEKIDKDFGGNFLLFGGRGFCIKTERIRIGGGGCGGPLLAKDDDVEGGMGYGGFILEYFVYPKISTSILIGGGGYTLEKTLEKGDILKIKRKEGSFFALEPAISLKLLSREIKKPKECEMCPCEPFFETYIFASYLLANIGGENIGGPMLGIQFIFGGKETMLER